MATQARPTVDFDHHSKRYALQSLELYARMRAECPVAWSEHHGGFWVVTRYDDVARVARDDLTFSSRHDLEDPASPFQGITHPAPPVRSVPIELDPPEFNDYRRIFNPPFSPAAIERLKPKMLEFTTACLDRRVEAGSIDFVLDLANPVPGLATLQFLGLPLEEWEAYAGPMHAIVYTPPDSPEFPKTADDAFGIVVRLAAAVEERRRQPRDDLITYLLHAEVDGERLSDERVVEMCHLVIAGGVDTTTALIAQGLDYLDRNRQARQRLIEDPGLIPSACEEFLRYYTPTQALARTATKDVEVGGQVIREGERVLISWASADHDPSAFDGPDQIVLDRFPNRHAAFGLGAHRCLGSNFARAEFIVMLQQVLARMPDYELDRDGTERYESIGIVNGFVKMPATFTPGPRIGTAAVPGLD